MPGRGDGENKGREWKQAHQVSGPERRLLYLDGTEARPGLPEPVLNPKGHGGSEALIGGSAAGPSRAAAPVGADMGRGARWRQEDQQGDHCSCPGETMVAGNPGGGEEQMRSRERLWKQNQQGKYWIGCWGVGGKKKSGCQVGVTGQREELA